MTAVAARSDARVAEPIRWRNFQSEKDLTWILLRGQMGFRRGDMMLRGDGSSPVMMSPKEPAIAWDRYQAVEIRMLAEGGREIKIKIGDREFRQKLGSPGQYHEYRFPIGIDKGAELVPLLVMPTDSVTDLVAIRSIELIPRAAGFTEAAGRRLAGKREEYRRAIFVHSPSSLTYEVPIPPGASLHFGIGVTENRVPITFRVTAGSREVYSKTTADVSSWENAHVDLSSFAGQRVTLAFETTSEKPGTVALWANPLLTSSQPKRRLNVLIYMIDTLRPDHTSVYGYARDTTPYLKKLGAQGAVFDDCQAQATWTKPSVASLLTSLYSFTHGIRRDDDTIPKGAATLAEQLRAAGYVTASVVTNPMAGRLTGLDRGFDYLSEWEAVTRNVDVNRDRATDSAALNKSLFPWLEQHKDEPFFLYAHATDPHAPYEAPPEFEKKFADPAETPAFNRDSFNLKKAALRAGGFGVNRALCVKNGVDPDRFMRRSMDRYDAKILHNDASLEQLAGKLKELGLLENTLILVVSDHGEEFQEHGWTGHGQSLYEELARAVLVMWNPKLIPTARRVAEPVQLIDVMPTVLELLGLPVPGAVEGQSLAPLLGGQAFQRRGFVMTSRFAHPYSQHDEMLPENHIDSVASIDQHWKLIYREDGRKVGLKKVELYDRRADRADTKDVAAANSTEVDRRVTEIGKWLDEQGKLRNSLGRGDRVPMDKKAEDRLRSLGYLGGKR